ncbi:MAG: hypothetical protein ABFS09_13575 [Thermodesulfobacteriota bacterium]
MECQRLNKMIRSWYVQVQNETLAPARMVEFMEKHVQDCDECLMDLGIDEELKKITAIVLPPSKMTKPPKRAAKDMPEMPSAKDLAAIENEESKGDEDGDEESTEAASDDVDSDDDIEVEGGDVDLEDASLE